MKFYADNIFKAYKNDLYIFVGIFTVTLVIILSVQIIILPYITPSWHAGNGLLKGGDWVVFHATAVNMSEQIRTAGWKAWELRPSGWMPAGIAGAVYAVTWPKPWALAPLNAFIHAITALLVIKIILLFTKKYTAVLISAIPFIFFPTAMLWYTQIHRDGYNILGMLLFLYAFLVVIGTEERRNITVYKCYLGGTLFALGGITLIWLVRPYAVTIYLFIAILLTIFTTLILMVLAVIKRKSWGEVFEKIAMLVLIIAFIIPFSISKGVDKYKAEYPLVVDVQGEKVSSNLTYKEDKYRWENTSWVPDIIDRQLYSMAYLRSVRFQEVYGQTASGIDYDVSFHRATDFLSYLPRAMQIAFLAPFPRDWFQEGKYETTTFFRRVSAFEMGYIYFMLVPMIFAIWRWRKRIETFILSIFCIAMMLPIVYSVPNIGTIYRYRYGYLMLLVAFGTAALCSYILEKKHIRIANGEIANEQ